MPILQLVFYLIAIGVALWAANTYIPMDPKIKQILNIVVVICVIVGLLQLFGVFDALRGFRTPHV
jgi:undecaprenyl pyrophosphate phosphatase UppP